eukprot:CAMPEP_0181293146 /NCGR_PEP_ID=MMETSP1101-20121128/2905_1 /TAXON_ID=46948 /ORGANISM="Rhodomonas abbreviata, Strain Caron Lab Isolate" /LENGTH=322 /DNA_ID=CAMNT_0023397705 /DNA_START=237 /DNA_END=1201 /DNA_ORIENTATION=-
MFWPHFATVIIFAGWIGCVGTVDAAESKPEEIQAAFDAWKESQAQLARLEARHEMLEKVIALDQQALMDDMNKISNPPESGVPSKEEIVKKGKIDTTKLEAEQPLLLALREDVTKAKEEVKKAEEQYRNLTLSAPPSAPKPTPQPKQPPASAASTKKPQPKGEKDKDTAEDNDTAWNTSEPCGGPTSMGIAIWLETTDEGLRWLESEEGVKWLESEEGRKWLESEAGKGFPFTAAGEHFFNSIWGKKFLHSPAGKAWLRTPTGKHFTGTHTPWTGSVSKLHSAAIACLVAVLVAGGAGALAMQKGFDEWLVGAEEGRKWLES